VHQTMGRDLTGWVDNFGPALPSCTISGHTGWRHSEGLGMDGWGSFEALNSLVMQDYPEARQRAIDQGVDPALVRLIFVDVLDRFAWPVVPMQFVLRRSKSRPLLYQYNITLQALADTVEIPDVQIPEYGNSGLARTALSAASETIEADAPAISVPSAPSLGSVLRDFAKLATKVFDKVNGLISGVKNFATSIVNGAIGLARDLAAVGLGVFRTITNLANLPLDLKARAARVAAAFNQVVCIFQNALRPRKPYEQYDDLYGASNCSSTTGGRPPSPYAGLNVFELMMPDGKPANITGSALFSIGEIRRADPVLAPLPMPDVERNLQAIVGGVSV